MNDSILIWFILILFIAIGGLLPFVQDSFGVTTDTHKLNINPNDVNQLPTNPLSILTGKVLLSIASMFFWTFQIPWWLELVFFEPIRILLYILVYRLVRSGGG